MCFQDTLIKRVGMRATYLFGLLTFALAMLLTLIFPFVTIVNISAALSGFGTAVANTIPGTLITKYHAFPELYLSNANKTTVSRKGNHQMESMHTVIFILFYHIITKLLV